MKMPSHRHHHYFILIAYFVAASVWGNTAIRPTQQAVLQDKNGHYTISAITNPAISENFMPLHRAFAAGYTRDTHWFRLVFPPEQLTGQELWLEVQPPYLDDIALYIPTSQGWTEKKGGDHYPQSSRDLPYRGTVFRVNNWQGNQLYLRLKTSSSSVLLAQLWEPEHFAQAKLLEYGIFGFYYGAFFLIFTIVLLQGAWRNNTVHGLYLLNMIMTFLYMLGLNGFIANHFFPHNAWLSDHWISFFSMVACATTTLFYQKLLAITQKTLALWLLFRATFWLTLVAAFSSFIGIYNDISSHVHLMVTIMATSALLRSIWLFYHQKTRSKALILGHTFFLLGILSVVLALKGLLPGSIWLLHGPQIGNIPSMLVFGFILMKHIRNALEQQKEAEQRARLAEQEREKEQRIRREHAYLADMLSHELKTPLAMIDGAVQTLIKLNPDANEAESRRYQRIRRGVTRIDNLVHQLLHYERLDNGTLQPSLTPIRLRHFCQELIASHNGEQRIHLHCAPDLHLNADPMLLGICVGNLLSNALRYPPPSASIELNVVRQQQHILLTVKDNGPGIEEALREVIFERYVRGKTTGDTGGSGLGIYISRRIAALHQGQLELMAPSGEGACFQLTLPQIDNNDKYNDPYRRD